MTTPDHTNAPPPPTQPPPGVKMVQVSKDELEDLILTYQQLTAKSRKQETQVRAMANLTDVIAKQERMLDMSRRKAQQYESAYIASEAKLGHCLKLLISGSKDGSKPDIEAIEELIRVKQEDLYDEYSSVGSESETSGFSKSETKDFSKSESETQGGGDLETDCESDRKGMGQVKLSQVQTEVHSDTKLPSQKHQQSSSLQTTPGSKISNIKTENVGIPDDTIKTESKKVHFNQQASSNNDETDTIDGKFGDTHKATLASTKTSSGNNNSSSTMGGGESQMNEIINKLVQDKRQLKSIVEEFQKEVPEAWNAFLEGKRYENLVRNLRLEIANERIHTSQLQYLLAAKQDGSDHTLNRRAVELDKKVSKLTKQLAVKQTLLNSLKSEYDRLKNEKQNKSVTTEIIGQMFDIRNDGDWEKNLRLARERCEGVFQATERGMMELKRTVEELKSENDSLKEEIKAFASDLQAAQAAPKPSSSEADHQNSSWLYLKEENERLQNEATAYKHELEAKMKDLELAHSQIQIQKKQSEAERQSRIAIQERATEDQHRIIATLKVTEQKYRESQKQLQYRENECFQLQQQLDQIHVSNIELQQQLKQMTKYKDIYDTMVTHRASTQHHQHHQPHPPHQSLFDSHQSRPRGVLATGSSDIQVDYSDSPQTSPSYEQGNRSAVAAAAGGRDSLGRVIEGRVVSGSISGEVFKEAPHPHHHRSADKTGGEQHGLAEDCEGGNTTSGVLECPQCYREFKIEDREKFNDHCKKCMTG